MDKVVSLSFGEIALKGANRSYFINKLMSQVRNAVKDLGNPAVYQDLSKIFVEANDDNIDDIVKRVKNVFCIVLVSKCFRTNKHIEDIEKGVIEATEEILKTRNVTTFKIDGKRGDKKFYLNSMELARLLGGTVLKNFDNLKVDVHNPDVYIYVDIRENAYIYHEKIKAYGGLPIGTNGSGLLLLSGGIDSPVAGFMMAKRGVKIHAIHYHSYPFTSERAEEKVKSLAKILARYCGKFNLYSVNLLNIQKEINKNCPEDEMTIISRRFMMRIAEKVALKHKMDALITGESMGQVASQTIKGLNVTNSSVKLPVFRPLIGMDKTDIIEISQEIDSYETSILPFEDCCTVFLPKHPVTRPELSDIEESEKALDVEELINDAIEKMEVLKIEL